jgi:capsular polysaccharide export protein
VAKIDRGLVWAGQETPQLRTYFAKNGRILLRLEDGFLRSRGLGADLVPPMSLVVDDLGIYYDPGRESRLENLLNASDNLDGNSLMRARALRELLINAEVSKYNTGTPTRTDNIPAGREIILIPGQVEDDASIKLGAGNVRRNLELLRITRQQNPDAFILYKPHPDVEAQLRPGHVPQEDALRFADMVLNDIDAISAINACDKVCTITSLLGFEALIRGKHVTCHGLPFYAGWGQTTDLGPTTKRRTARPSITAMIHCVLIAYPRYFDPKTGLACPVEVVVERLGSGEHFQRSVTNKLLSKLQRRLAPGASIWR